MSIVQCGFPLKYGFIIVQVHVAVANSTGSYIILLAYLLLLAVVTVREFTVRCLR